MSLLLLAGMLLGGVPADPGEDRGALVSRLGASRYSDREAASKALRGLGVAALPELRAAVKTATDPELRSRATDLIAKIENAAMLQPTPVRFSYPGTPLAEVVHDLSTQSGFRIALDRPALTANHSDAEPLRFTADGPISFWEAVGRVAERCRLRVISVSSDHGIERIGPPIDVRLSLMSSAHQPPVSLSGPFRFKIDRFHYQRDRLFDQDADAEIDEQLYLTIELLAEPRLLIRQRGTIRVHEAVDELGQDLVPPDTVAEEDDLAMFEHFEPDESSRQDLQIFLKHPERMGSSLKTLRGTVPLEVRSRKLDPLSIPLEGSVGKTFTGDEMIVTVHSIHRDAVEPRTSVLLGVRFRSDPNEGPESEAPRSLALGTQFGARDARGRSLATFAGDFVPDGAVGVAEMAVSLSIALTEETGPPSHLEVYGLNRAKVDVPFVFHDVPMP